MTMTDGEICEMYRTAKEKAKEIKILAECNATSKEKIVNVLEAGGYKVDKRVLNSSRKKVRAESAEKPNKEPNEVPIAADLALLIAALRGSGAKLTIEVTL